MGIILIEQVEELWANVLTLGGTLENVIAVKAGHTQHLGFLEAIVDASDCWELIE